MKPGNFDVSILSSSLNIPLLLSLELVQIIIRTNVLSKYKGF